MRARYYNPDIKRFINQDIKVGDIGSSQSMNRYAYCEGNPVSLVDPFGLSPESTQDQGKESKYQWLHNILDVAGIFFDGADLINGFIYAAEGDPINAAISFACGIPAIGTVITVAAKTAKLAKYATTAAKIAKVCRDVGKIGNTAAGMKALYDTYQTAERECETTGEKIAYIAGTVITGYLIGKAAQWGAGKLKNLASKAMPKLKTALKESAGKLVSKANDAFGSFGNKSGKGTTIITHRGTNENIARKLEQGYLPANYPNPNNVVTKVLDHNKPAVWVSKGKPNLFNRIFSGMVGKRGEASITFEVDSGLVKKPNGLIKRFFGKAQRVIEEDVPIPDNVIVKWGGDKQ